MHDESYWREWYEERAAILEYDGEWPRMVAQRLARGELKAAREREDTELGMARRGWAGHSPAGQEHGAYGREGI